MVKDDKFPFYLRRSFYIHCALLALTLLGGKVVLNRQLELRNKNIELIQASVRVDMVAMPKYTLQELKAMTPEPAVEQAKVEPEKIPEPKVEAKVEPKEDFKEKMAKEVAEAEKKQSFLSKLKNLSKQKISKGETKKLQKLVLAGNKLSKGTQAYGDSHGADLTAFQAYSAQVADKVRGNWKLPQFLLTKKLKCLIQVWVARNGQVVRTAIYQPSTDDEFDRRAVEAVSKTSLPAPSDEFANRALNEGILLAFPK